MGYIEDVLNLSNNINSDMPKEEKIKRILKSTETAPFRCCSRDILPWSLHSSHSARVSTTCVGSA